MSRFDLVRVNCSGSLMPVVRAIEKGLDTRFMVTRVAQFVFHLSPQLLFFLALFLPAIDAQEFRIYSAGGIRPHSGLEALLGSYFIWAALFDTGTVTLTTKLCDVRALVMLTYFPCNFAIVFSVISSFRWFKWTSIIFFAPLLIGCVTSLCVFWVHVPSEIFKPRAFFSPHIGYFLWIVSIYLSTFSVLRGIMIGLAPEEKLSTNNSMHPSGESAAS